MEVIMPSSMIVFDIEVDAPEAGGPYQIMTVDEDGLIVAFFAVKVTDTGDMLKDWVPAPLPRPFAKDNDLLSAFAESLHQEGYQFLYKDDQSIH